MRREHSFGKGSMSLWTEFCEYFTVFLKVSPVICFVVGYVKPEHHIYIFIYLTIAGIIVYFHTIFDYFEFDPVKISTAFGVLMAFLVFINSATMYPVLNKCLENKTLAVRARAIFC